MLFVEVLAVGPFRAELIEHYEYPAAAYATALPTAPMMRRLFGIAEGTSAGTAFAATLGVHDVWDFNQHRIDPAKIDYENAQLALTQLGSWDEGEYGRDLASLRAFAEAGYELYLVPNG